VFNEAESFIPLAITDGDVVLLAKHAPDKASFLRRSSRRAPTPLSSRPLRRD